MSNNKWLTPLLLIAKHAVALLRSSAPNSWNPPPSTQVSRCARNKPHRDRWTQIAQPRCVFWPPTALLLLVGKYTSKVCMLLLRGTSYDTMLLSWSDLKVDRVGVLPWLGLMGVSTGILYDVTQWTLRPYIRWTQIAQPRCVFWPPTALLLLVGKYTSKVCMLLLRGTSYDTMLLSWSDLKVDRVGVLPWLGLMGVSAGILCGITQWTLRPYITKRWKSTRVIS